MIKSSLPIGNEFEVFLGKSKTKFEELKRNFFEMENQVDKIIKIRTIGDTEKNPSNYNDNYIKSRHLDNIKRQHEDDNKIADIIVIGHETA